jgi:hypothetical protein
MIFDTHSFDHSIYCALSKIWGIVTYVFSFLTNLWILFIKK